MSLAIEDYALIGDCHSAALVGRDGSIAWLCLPRFDAPACFAALLGDSRHGHWLITPSAEVRKQQRRYRNGTLILETDFETTDGAVRLIDFMLLDAGRQDVIRIVEGLRGRVSMHLELIIRFDYGSIVPWVRRLNGALLAVAGPDTLEFRSDVPVHGENFKTVAQFEIVAGERQTFALNYRLSHQPPPPRLDPEQALLTTESSWRAWSNVCSYHGPWREHVVRSLIALKALIYEPTGGIVAAPTTSLPEQWGGVRNWDYRYCWVRDATYTLNALLLAGYHTEAISWREWLLRSVAGTPEDLQSLYSVTGERRLNEVEIGWLPGYQGAMPVRVGNAAWRQFQLDVFGELMDTLHLTRAVGLEPDRAAWRIQLNLMRYLESAWQQPDEGIWEVRGPRRHFTHSKVMAWVAFDRAVKDAELYGLDGPVEHWKDLRASIHEQVCSKGFDARRNTFVQSYDTSFLDASLLLIPQVGFLPPDDPRVLGTIAAIEQNLVFDGLVLRYSTATHVDALPPGEGTFLPCSFWLADSYALTGRRQEAIALFECLLGLCNEVGLLAEEYDPRERRMLGNYPQALTHMALINTARLLSMSTEQVQHACRIGKRPAAANSLAAS